MPRNLDPEGLSVLRFVQRYSDARKRGLSKADAAALMLDKKAHENATLTDLMEEESHDD